MGVNQNLFYDRLSFLLAFLVLLELEDELYLYLPVSHLLQIFVFWNLIIIYSIGPYAQKTLALSSI